MSDNHLLYPDGVEICSGDRVLVNGREQGVIAKVFQPGDIEAADYALCEGGFLVEFDSGDIQAWSTADEDIEKLSVQKSE
ncbi:MAG: hypothetical protein WCT05_11885 [Lentisphaeria bacterium]